MITNQEQGEIAENAFEKINEAYTLANQEKS